MPPRAHRVAVTLIDLKLVATNLVQAPPATRLPSPRLPGVQKKALSESFTNCVMEIFHLADIREELIWHTENGQVHLAADVSDVFDWGYADTESITPKTLPILKNAFADLKSAGAPEFTAVLYAARVRGRRPQGAAYPKQGHRGAAQVAELFSVCGPEREVGPTNPRLIPAYTPGPAEKEVTS